MTGPDPEASAGEEPTLLFEEYLEALGAGREPDAESLARRAGRREEELRKRIAVFRSLEELSELALVGPEAEDVVEPVLERLGRYRDLRLIGEGGLSRVFVAHDTELARQVALKLLKVGQGVLRNARDWMQNEGRSLARLEHPNVLKVYDVGETDGQAYISTEYLDGPSLQRVLDRMRARARGEPSVEGTEEARVDELARELEPLGARVRLVRALAGALAYCHAQGVVHRDLKPGNVILQPGPTPKLIDFGIAHLESDEESRIDVTQSLVGTPAYLAPEQIDAGRTGASEHSDQFVLGALLYELLTLENPFQRKTWHATIDLVSRADPIAPSRKNRLVPLDLERICLHALERSPAARYPSVAALEADLAAFEEHRSISLLPPTPWKVAALWARRNRRDLVLASAVILLAIGSVVGLVLWRGSRVREEFDSRLAQARTRIPALDTSSEFALTYAILGGYEKEALGLDRAWTALLLGDGHFERVRELVFACSYRLWEKFESLLPANRMLQGPIDQIEESRIFREWRPIFALDELFCPTGPHNEVNRTRGTWIAPTIEPGERFVVQEFRRAEVVQIAGNPDLAIVPFSTTPVPGTYRFSLYDAADVRVSDIDIDIAAHHLRTPVVMTRIDPALLTRMCLVPWCELDFDPTHSREPVQVPSFRVSLLITWNDLESVFSADEVDRRFKSAVKRGSPADRNAPADLMFKDAQRFATLSGARLPTPVEWCALTQFHPDACSHADVRITGEYVHGRYDDAKARVSYYAPWTHGLVPRFAEVRPEGFVGEPQAFRVVFSDP